MSDKEVLREQIVMRMQTDNPWWTTGRIPGDIDKMHCRAYIDMLYEQVSSNAIRRAIVLMGPRRVGKTILIYHTIARLIANGVSPQRIVYLSVDTPIYNGFSLERLLLMANAALMSEANDLRGFYVFYDEVQYLKDWELHLKSLVDTYRQTRFVVLGSATAALHMKSRESGAGRFHDFILPPLTFNEFLHLQDMGHLMVRRDLQWNGKPIRGYDTINITELNKQFLRYINYGGYPEVVFSPEIQQDPSRYMQHDIVDKVMLKDLPNLYGISDTQELYRLFIHIAYRSGEEFTVEDLSQTSGIRKDVIRRYLTYLESAFLIKVIHRVDVNARKMQRITRFKIYLTNPSLRCALFAPLSNADPAVGSMVETAIFAQRIQRDDEELYYANWKMGRKDGEVDMVALDRLRQKPSWAVEIKWSDRYFEHPGELKSLLSFIEENDCQNEAIVTSMTRFGTQVLQRVNLLFIPAAVYAYQLGKNTLESRKSSLRMSN